ncbi:hypothetical protein HK098_005255 [Nowakowskiella sp. JEL0407]|nr:hypothetical protein HK098_005255 [Nowakowskiella sp. JEL0407]
MESFVFFPHHAKYQALLTRHNFSIEGGLPFLNITENDELIIIGTLTANSYGYFYNINTKSFGFLPMLDTIALRSQDPNLPNTFNGVHPRQHFYLQNLPLQPSKIPAPSVSPLQASSRLVSSTNASYIATTVAYHHPLTNLVMPAQQSTGANQDVNEAMIQEGEPASPKTKEKNDKRSVTFLRSQQKYCKGKSAKEGALIYPAEVFNLLLPMYNYMMANKDGEVKMVHTPLFESILNERMSKYTDNEIWRVWNNSQVDFVTPYTELKRQFPNRFTNPMIFEMFLIFNEWEESGNDLTLLLQEVNGLMLVSPQMVS